MKFNISWSISIIYSPVILATTILNLGEGNGNPLQYSCLENPMDGGAWWTAVHGLSKSQTWLSNFTFTFHFHALEKEMATHSSVVVWRIPGTAEPDGLPSMGLHRVEHDWIDLAATAFSVCSGPGSVSARFHLCCYSREEMQVAQVTRPCSSSCPT